MQKREQTAEHALVEVLFGPWVWKGLHTISDYKETPSCTADSTESLPDELNSLYVRFEL